MTKRSRPTKIFHPLLWFVLVSLIVWSAISLFAAHNLPENGRLSKLVKAGYYSDVETILEGLLIQSPTDLDLNYSYINNHFNIPVGPSRDDQKLITRYTDLANQLLTADLGNYGLGLIESQRENYDKALEYFQKIKETRMRYLANSFGYIYSLRRESAPAEHYFLNEIADDGNVPAAANNLAKLYLQTNNTARLKTLAGDARAIPYLRPEYLRPLAFRIADIGGYLHLAFIEPLQSILPEAWLDALLVSLMFLFFFWRFDLITGEPLWLTVVALLLGCIAALVFYLLSDGIALLWPIYPDGQLWKDLMYNILHLGLAREIAKLLPVLLLLSQSKWGRGPKEIILFGSLSALGFSLIQNAQNFTLPGPGMAFYYFMFNSVLNLASTSIVCYLWIYRSIAQKKRPFWLVIAGLAAAAVVHGWFDYFLVERFAEQILISMVIAVVLAVFYGWMLKNALSLTDYFHKDRPINLRLVAYEWVVSLALTFCLTAFLIDNFAFSTPIANQILLRTLLTTLLLAVLVFAGVGELGLSPTNLLPAVTSSTPNIPSAGERK